jgi:putative colanic acid biosynthesis acetyltransferase WcaF
MCAFSSPPQAVDNSKFNPLNGLVRGRSRLIEALWCVVRAGVFMSSLPWPCFFKRRLLILFGAKIGKGFYIRPRVCIHFPWKLEVGDYCWIGDDCGLLNLESVRLGNHVAIAHRVYIATGNHDFTDSAMAYRNSSITIHDGAWVASCAFIGPGVVLGEHCVVAAGAIVTKSVEPWTVVKGNPAVKVGVRVLKK